MIPETILAGLLFGGLLLFIIGYLWYLRRAFKLSALWGLSLVIFAGMIVYVMVRILGLRFAPIGLLLAAFIMGFLLMAAQQFRAGLVPLLLMYVGALMACTPLAHNMYQDQVIGLAQVLQTMQDEKTGEVYQSLTLTGWDRGKDQYAMILAAPGVNELQVVQMANPDVDDEVLTNLLRLKHLKELDVNDTAVTDAGLKTLQALLSLQRVRLRATKVTDDGVKTFLDAMPNLREVDVRETAVKSKTMRDWKNQRKDERNFMK